MKKYDALDLTKIILSFMIVAIHTELFPKFLYPWLRLAVPLFFIISSFLLYTKINNSESQKEKIILKNYIYRLLKYYFFWLIALLPITIYARRVWFTNGILVGMINVIIKPFIGSTFIASWYIAALIIGNIIIYYLSKLTNNFILILLCFISYIICCISSSYSFLVTNNNTIFHFFDFEIYCSFFVSLIYILVGKIFSERKIIIKPYINIFLIIISCLFLYFEWSLVYKASGTLNNDCYFMLLPTSIFIFNYIINLNIHINNSAIIRQYSSFLYPLHGSVAVVLVNILPMFFNNSIIISIVNYFATISICLICFIIVKQIEKKYPFLKLSY